MEEGKQPTHDDEKIQANEATAPAVSAAEPRPGKKTRTVTPTAHAIPYLRHADLKTHIDLVRAYVARSPDGKRELKYTDFPEESAGVSQTIVTGNNLFLSELGFLRKGKERGSYAPTAEALAFATALSWRKEEEAKSIVRQLVEKSWIWKTAAGLFIAKSQLATSEITAELGHVARANPDLHGGSLHLLVEYMQYAGLLSAEKEGLYVLGEGVSQPRTEEDQRVGMDTAEIIADELPSQAKSEGRSEHAQDTSGANRRLRTEASPAVSIELKLDLSGLDDERLRRVLRWVHGHFD